MTNEEKVEAVKKWQECEFVHQFVCGADGCDGVLVPEINKGLNGGVYLLCPKCSYSQDHIPDMVYYFDFEHLSNLMSVIGVVQKAKAEEDDRINEALSEIYAPNTPIDDDKHQ